MNIEILYKHFLQSSGICTDTRHISNNCLFFALKGENFNGNLFAVEALEKGARLVVIDDPAFHSETGNTNLVQDTLITLQELARFHREHLSAKIIGLTGSNGKTTTKELINAVLSQKFRTVATKGNLNNHIGVPLSLLSIPSNAEFGIIEMGANHLGEIEMLSNIAKPDYGYITNFGKAHLEGFGSLEGVIKGKTELFTFLRDNDKTVFINNYDEKQLANSNGMQRITFGNSESEFEIKLLDAHKSLVLEYDETEINSNLVGSYNYANISSAIAIGAYFGVPIQKIKQGIESYIPSNNRSQLLSKNTNTILMDAYNANPTSMMAALENFKQAEGKNKILYLGDMFELGADTADEHQNIVNFLIENNFGSVYLVGENFFGTNSSSTLIEKFRNFEDFKKEVQRSPPTHSSILIKASRGMAMERILDVM